MGKSPSSFAGKAIGHTGLVPNRAHRAAVGGISVDGSGLAHHEPFALAMIAPDVPARGGGVQARSGPEEGHVTSDPQGEGPHQSRIRTWRTRPTKVRGSCLLGSEKLGREIERWGSCPR